MNHTSFAPQGFLDPTSTSSHDALRDFATKLMLPFASPLFKPVSTEPPSPLNTPSSSPPTSPLQDTTDSHNNRIGDIEPEGTSEPAMISFPPSTPAQTNPQPIISRPLFTSTPPPPYTQTTPIPPIPDSSIAPQPAVSTATETLEGPTPGTSQVPEEGATSTVIGVAAGSPRQEQDISGDAVIGVNGNNKAPTKRKRGSKAPRPPVSTRRLRSCSSNSHQSAATTSDTYATSNSILVLLYSIIFSARRVLVHRQSEPVRSR